MGNKLDSVFRESPHRRFNPLNNEWVLVSPHRTQRPWQGAVESVPQAQRPQYDPSCYLCPGNQRANGALNPQYHSTFVFENDFAALRKDVSAARLDVDSRGLLVAETEAGICRVMCFSPRHDLTLATMESQEIEPVIREWSAQTQELSRIEGIHHVQIFENRGEMMGASNPHPHCQIWATATVPQAPARELLAQRNYRDKNHSCLLCEYMELEEKQNRRIVCSNPGFIALVPFWAVWPFEVLVSSRRHLASFPELKDGEVSQLSELLKQLTSTYDRIFDVPFPYSMGFHQHPFDGDAHPEWHFHAHFYPPLLRSASVRKFMVGFEMLGTPQRDITPELAAEKLRSIAAKKQ
ncbi:MAG TPA: UDP-glucose--hexose-1-phosphate uridylyltransferase [Terriglobales bacterium]|jgi:UDPglucose--hexose-1-phosphate uridylyltransferase|nr:UDP-glucose--hexose-1-phosphate uridylyltransferase [Terriglobales bacterium]